MKTIELAIFDYDGVIVDSFSVLHQSYGQICKELDGKFETDFEKFKASYMRSKNHITFMDSIGISKDKHAQADAIYKREQQKRITPFFEGIEGLLRKISHCMQLAIVSSNHVSEIEERLAKNNLLYIFNNIIANETDGQYFHKSKPMKRVVREAGCSFDAVVAIGDRTRDFIYAKEAGIPSENIILVDYGWGYDAQKVDSAGYCLKTKVDSPIKILDALKEIELR